jgi:hypothetical protein
VRPRERPLPWTSIFGRQAAQGLVWLERAAGPAAVQKFLGAKVRGTPFSGRYVLGIASIPSGRRFICMLLQLLREGREIPLCDVASYHRAGKRWPLGMRLVDGWLADVWAERPGPLPTPSSPINSIAEDQK